MNLRMDRIARPNKHQRKPVLRDNAAAETADASAPNSPAEVARYIADMTAQLTSMAAAARLDLLTYFLSMANAESTALAQGTIPFDRP